GHYHLFATEKTLTLTALVLAIATIVVTPTQTTVLRAGGGYHSPRATPPYATTWPASGPPKGVVPAGAAYASDHPCRGLGHGGPPL
ncbi:hypothetical protein B296_00039719, partial [Ensete ventricosum]